MITYKFTRDFTVRRPVKSDMKVGAATFKKATNPFFKNIAYREKTSTAPISAAKAINSKHVYKKGDEVSGQVISSKTISEQFLRVKSPVGVIDISLGRNTPLDQLDISVDNNQYSNKSSQDGSKINKGIIIGMSVGVLALIGILVWYFKFKK